MDNIVWIIIVQAIIFVPVCADLAHKKGKDELLWCVIGLFLGPIGYLILSNLEFEMVRKPVSVLSIAPDSILIPNQYIDFDCPVGIYETVIMINKRTGNTFCAVGFINLFYKRISELKFKITCYDSLEVPIKTSPHNCITASISGLSAAPRTKFGIYNDILLADLAATRRVEIAVLFVLFEDESTWSRQDCNIRQIQAHHCARQEVVNLKSVIGSDAISYAQKIDDAWICVCSQVNKIEIHKKCRRCGREMESTINNYSLDSADTIEIQAANLKEKPKKPPIIYVLFGLIFIWLAYISRSGLFLTYGIILCVTGLLPPKEVGPLAWPFARH